LRGENVQEHHLAFETKVTLRNDLFSKDFLVKTNPDKDEDADNHQFYTNFDFKIKLVKEQT